MKINRKSWHYRFMVNVMQMTPPDYLCQYFWKLVLSFVLVPIMIVILPIIAIIWPFCYLTDKIKMWYYNWNFDYEESNNIFIAYFRAFKAKACPFIEYYEE